MEINRILLGITGSAAAFKGVMLASLLRKEGYEIDVILTDDLLSSAFMACDAPVVMAPSMNTRMWSSGAVAANVKTLESRGVIFAGPVTGTLACGSRGEGRLMEPTGILKVCLGILTRMT